MCHTQDSTQACALDHYTLWDIRIKEATSWNQKELKRKHGKSNMNRVLPKWYSTVAKSVGFGTK